MQLHVNIQFHVNTTVALSIGRVETQVAIHKDPTSPALQKEGLRIMLDRLSGGDGNGAVEESMLQAR